MINTMRRSTVSLNLFTDSTPWLAEGFGLGRDLKFSENVKNLIRKIILTELTPLQREMISLYYYKGMSMTDIAKSRNVNKSSVSRTLKSARERISKSLKYGSFHMFEPAD